MHAAISSDLATPFAADIDQARQDALRTIHKLMLHLADTLTKPAAEGSDGAKKEQENSQQARTATQRIRLCLQAARDILRFGSPTKREGTPTRPWRGGKLGPAHDDTQAAQSRTDAPSDTHAADTQEAKHILAAAGSGVPCDGRRSRLEPEGTSAEHRSASIFFGERLSSPLTSQDSRLVSLPLSSVPSVNSVVKSSSRALTPPPVSFEDGRQIMQIVRDGGILSVELYEKYQAFAKYAQATGLPPPYGFTTAQVEACSPYKPSTS